MVHSSFHLFLDDVFTIITCFTFMFLPYIFPLLSVIMHIQIPMKFLFVAYSIELLIIFIAIRYYFYDTVRVNLLIFLFWYFGLIIYILFVTFIFLLILLIFLITWPPIKLVDYIKFE